MVRRKVMVKRTPSNSGYYLYGKMVGYVGGAGMIMSWAFGSIAPMAIVCAGLFGILCFMSGLR